MSVRFGVSPIAWANDDMPELGADTPLSTILADAREIGFEGVELGGKFPRDPAVLEPLIARYGLSIVGGWYSASLLVRDVDAEIEAAEPHLQLLQAMGCEVFIHAETSNAIHSNRSVPLSRTPRLTAADWRSFGERVSRFAAHIRERGLKFAYHHRVGTVVETQGDLEAFLAATAPHVGLTLDTGHAALAGIDSVAVIRTHAERIAHVHCKDVRFQVFEDVSRRDISFLDGVLQGMFTAPGDGGLDYAAVMRALAEIGYRGWIIVEAEQDPDIADPRTFSRLGLATLVREATAAGLKKVA